MSMEERKGYQNTDELQADDEISPRPSFDDKDGLERPRRDVDHGEDDAARIPRPATSQ